jgi:hypothetical protein
VAAVIHLPDEIRPADDPIAGADAAQMTRSTVGAGLLANAVVQAPRGLMTHRVRQQAGSYGFAAPTGFAACSYFAVFIASWACSVFAVFIGPAAYAGSWYPFSSPAYSDSLCWPCDDPQCGGYCCRMFCTVWRKACSRAAGLALLSLTICSVLPRHTSLPSLPSSMSICSVETL